MKNKKTVISILLISAACTTPAFAYSINSPEFNLHSNIGSRPNPTAHDIQEHNVPQLAHRKQPTSNIASAPAQGQRADRVQSHTKSASTSRSLRTTAS
jgi:hypothetical protein